MENKPNFLVIGAAKSGTISLYHYLNQHPQVFMCPARETNFFSLQTLDLQRNFQGPQDRDYLDEHAIRDRESYLSLFSHAAPEMVRGEISPLYLYHPKTAQSIKDFNPDIRLIAVLRHPVERAYSNYLHFRRAGLEPLDSFPAAIAQEPARIAAGWGPWPFWHYLEMGFYARQLASYYTIFDPSQIQVHLFADLCMDPGALVQRIYQFIGVDSAARPDIATRHNLGGQPKFPYLKKWLTGHSASKRLLQRWIPLEFRTKVRHAVDDWNRTQPRLDPDLRARLIEMFRPDILDLQEMIRRDLSAWLV